MNVKYPIFVRDREGWMFLLSSEDNINYHLEHIDVEYNEYDGWDIGGRPVGLFIEDKRIKAKYVSEESNIEAVRKAILNYAKIATKVPFAHEKADNEIINLFNKVEEHIRINKTGLLKKIKTKLSEIFRELKEGLYWALANLLFIAISFLLDVKSWDAKYGVTWVFSGVLILFAWLNIIIIKIVRKIIARKDFKFRNIMGLVFYSIGIIFGWFGIYMTFRFLLTLWISD
jgi:hypothetical protein